MIYEYCKIYGPYQSKEDGRYRVVSKYLLNGELTTISYPKYLMEIKLQRYLDENEEVHHIDGDVTNNHIDNLELLIDRTHAHKHSKYKDEYWVCAYCDNLFAVTAKQVGNRARNVRGGKTRGPYCSKRCNGKANN